MKLLENKSALITGGVRGIGKAIAKEFCKNGCNVLICYRSNDVAAQEALTELETFGTKVVLLKGDVSDAAHSEEAVALAKESFGRLDILVNNAGITNDKLIMRMSPDDFDKVIQTNLSGSYYFLKNASSVMVKQKSGCIINLSSIVGVKGNPGQVNYSASKAGIIGMTLSAAKELGRRGIRVNAIAPGFVETDMTGVLTEDQMSKLSDSISLGRVGKAEDIANAALYLASDMAAYVTGQVLGVDGGLSL